MRLEPGWAIKTLEHFLYNYYDEVRKLHEMKRNIIESSPAQFQEAGGGGVNYMSNPTELKGIKLASNKDIIEKEKWLKVVKDVIKNAEIHDKLYGTKYFMLINKKYFDELGEEQICNELNIEHTTFYNWRRDIIQQGINFATAIGLITYKDFQKVQYLQREKRVI